jgi:hypothetical protein
MALIPYHQVQTGGYYDNDNDLRSFSGNMYQRGGGIGNVLKGFVKHIIPLAKRTATAVGKNALNIGLQTARDFMENKDVKQSLIKNTKAAGANMARNLLTDLSEQTIPKRTPNNPSGYKRKRKHPSTNTTQKQSHRSGGIKRVRRQKDIFSS